MGKRTACAALVRVAVVFLTSVGLGRVGTTGEAGRPNVLLLMVDDLRTEIGCYGCSQVQTPHIDRLAERGMRFDRAYVQAAFCNPSRVSLLTGLRPDSTGVLDNNTWFRHTLPDAVTMPQLFKENGYFTMRLGKIFHGTQKLDDPKGWNVAIYPEGTQRGATGQGRNLTGGQVKWCRWMAANGGDEDQPDGQIAAQAVEFLSQDHEQPFLLAVGFHKPHDPFVAPARYFDLYPLGDVQLYRDPPGRSPDPPLAIPRGWKVEFDKFTDGERREFLRAYHACVSFVDAQIGKVLAALDRSEFGQNTIIALLSDHGYHLGERGWWNKNTLFELTARTPLIVYAPGMQAQGASCSRLVEFVDIYPTLAELCSLPAPDGLQGLSFTPLLNDPRQPWKEAARMQLVRGSAAGRTVRTQRWRYTEWDEGRQGAELYDHRSDPGEYHNLIEDPARAQQVQRLKQLLRPQSSADRGTP